MYYKRVNKKWKRISNKVGMKAEKGKRKYRPSGSSIKSDDTWDGGDGGSNKSDDTWDVDKFGYDNSDDYNKFVKGEIPTEPLEFSEIRDDSDDMELKQQIIIEYNSPSQPTLEDLAKSYRISEKEVYDYILPYLQKINKKKLEEKLEENWKDYHEKMDNVYKNYFLKETFSNHLIVMVLKKSRNIIKLVSWWRKR